MSANPQTCDEVELEVLLTGSEASAEYRTVAGHVESCASCQDRLTTLAAEPSWWNEAHALLSGECEIRWQPDTSQSELILGSGEQEVAAAESIHDHVLSLLGAPGHPEMLGRLGRYDIERIIGSGGMGVVLKAHDSELNRPIAIKLLAPHLAHVGAARGRLAREGRAAAAVVHEHVVAIYNVESGGPVPFLVMQYVPGRSLQARVDEDGPLSVEEILRIGMQAAAGLAAAHHQGLVHRDVKPSNILLENQVDRAVLTDFGLARAIDDASLTQTGILAGTPHYMSPEQAMGGPIDHRSDLFSLGAVLYFMATGHPPFRATGTLAVLHRICREQHRPVWQLNKEMPDELCDVIDILLSKKPNQRPATADEVQQQLAALLSRAQQRGLGRRRWRALRGRRISSRTRWITTAATMILALAATFAWRGALWSGDGASNSPSTTEVAAPAISPEPGNDTAARQIERDLLRGWADVQTAMGQTSGTSFYFHQGSDRWQYDLQSIQRDLDQLEFAVQVPKSDSQTGPQ